MPRYVEECDYDIVTGMAPTRNGFAGGALEGRIAGLAIENSADVLCEVAVSKQYTSRKIEINAFTNLSVRTTKTHVALWRPTLTSDQEGNFQIEFDVPDDNTTWCMQALAFSKTMATCLMQKEILAQRTLMVQPSLPRFLRSGDKTQLMANVQNAADSAVKAVALVELFDPRTDKVLKSKKFVTRESGSEAHDPRKGVRTEGRQNRRASKQMGAGTEDAARQWRWRTTETARPAKFIDGHGGSTFLPDRRTRVGSTRCASTIGRQVTQRIDGLQESDVVLHLRPAQHC